MRKFNEDSVQQPGTYAQQAHGSKSVKGHSCAATKKRVVDDGDTIPNSSLPDHPIDLNVAHHALSQRKMCILFQYLSFVTQEIKNGIYLVVPRD